MLTETSNLTLSAHWRIENMCWPHLLTHPISLNLVSSFASCCTVLISILFMSASPWNHVRGITSVCRALKPGPCCCTELTSLFSQDVLILNVLRVQIAPNLTLHFVGSCVKWNRWTVAEIQKNRQTDSLLYNYTISLRWISLGFVGDTHSKFIRPDHVPTDWNRCILWLCSCISWLNNFRVFLKINLAAYFFVLLTVYSWEANTKCEKRNRGMARQQRTPAVFETQEITVDVIHVWAPRPPWHQQFFLHFI